jgi:hypothetical protein
MVASYVALFTNRGLTPPFCLVDTLMYHLISLHVTSVMPLLARGLIGLTVDAVSRMSLWITALWAVADEEKEIVASFGCPDLNSRMTEDHLR